MKLMRSLRYVVLAPLALALAGGHARAAEVPFEVHGSFTILEQYDKHEFEVALEGTASVGGPFVGQFVANRNGHGSRIRGTVTLVFAEGTLTFKYGVAYDPATDLFEGDFRVTEGSGVFAGATGSGEIRYPLNSWTQPFMMSGALNL